MSEPVYRVPFVADAAAETGWVPALRAAMPELRIAPLREFTDAELAECEVAIVANPSPADLRRMPRPHISGPTDRGTASAIVAGNIRTYRDSGKIPPHVHRERGY